MSSADTAARNRRVGATIRRRRQALDWEQLELATRVGVHVNTVQKWEAGTHYPMRKLGKLEEVLGVTLDEPKPRPALSTETQERMRADVGDEMASKLIAHAEHLATGRTAPAGASRPRESARKDQRTAG